MRLREIHTEYSGDLDAETSASCNLWTQSVPGAAHRVVVFASQGSLPQQLAQGRPPYSVGFVCEQTAMPQALACP